MIQLDSILTERAEIAENKSSRKVARKSRNKPSDVCVHAGAYVPARCVMRAENHYCPDCGDSGEHLCRHGGRTLWEGRLRRCDWCHALYDDDMLAVLRDTAKEIGLRLRLVGRENGNAKRYTRVVRFESVSEQWGKYVSDWMTVGSANACLTSDEDGSIVVISDAAPVDMRAATAEANVWVS